MFTLATIIRGLINGALSVLWPIAVFVIGVILLALWANAFT
jgi:hypothetical protein